MASRLSVRTWVEGLFGAVATAQRRARAGGSRKLCLEHLESRVNPTTTISIADSSVLEPMPGGMVNLDFTVTRTGDLISQLTVGYTTVAGTAQPNTDFTPTTGTVTFASGSATATIGIPVFGKSEYENPSLTFSVQLTGIVNVVGPPVTLSSNTDFATGNSPISVVVGDVNGDGRPDIITANAGDNTVSVLLNTTPPGATTPTFAAEQSFAVGNLPDSVALGDINGDGLPDIIAVNQVDQDVSVLINTTTPGSSTVSFATQQTFAVGTDPQSVAVGDLNGDGLPDLVVANGTASGTVSVLFNTTTPGSATASFATQQVFPVGSEPQTVAVADLNGDGKLDIITTNLGDNTVSVLGNTTTPGSATASFATAQTFAVGDQPFGLAVADFNGDGSPDLAVSYENDGTVGVLLNTTAPGSMTFSFAAQTFTAEPSLQALAVADLDGDGKPDLIAANISTTGANDLTVLMNTTATGATTASFSVQTGIDLGTGTQPRSLAVGDFNGDGLPDLATANFGPNTTSVLLNTTVLPTVAPTFVPQTTNTGGDLTAVAIGDINGDGKPDIVVSDFLNNSVKVLLNTTPPGAITPTFAAPVSFNIGNTSRSLVLADMNGDGLPDIVIGPESNSVSVLVNTTTPGSMTPTFAPIQNFNAGGSTAVAVADLNGDGLPDIVSVDIGYPDPLSNASAVAVLINTTTPGSTTLSFAAPQFFATGNVSVYVALGDLNGDGKPDIVVANQQDNTVSVLLNTTTPGSLTASFTTQQTFATGNTPVSVALGDINGDGLPDIVVANSGSNTISVLLNTTPPGASTPSFATQQTFATGSGPNAVALADVNGDGRPDLIVPNINDGTVSVLLNTTAAGASTASFATQQTFTTGPDPNSAAVGDLTNDGRADLVTTNDGSGAQLTVSSQSPGTITSGTATGTITETDSPPTVEFSAASESVNDTAGTFSVTVSLSTASGVDTTIPFTLGGTAVAGTDYSGVTASPLVISAGQTTATITGTLLDNDIAGAANKTLTFTLGSPTNATLGTTTSNTLTIVNTATPTVEFSAASESVNDTAGTFSVMVSLSTASGVDTTIPFTLGGTAVAGTDYSGVTASPLDISAGQTTVTITGTLLDNDLFGAADKTLTFTLGTPTNATLGTTTSNTLTIVNTATQPTVEFTAASESVNDTAGTFSVTLSLSTASGVDTAIRFTLGGTAVAGTDYSGVSGIPLLISAGQTTATITGTLLDNDVFGAANKTLTFTLGTPTNATLGTTVSNTLTIVNTATEPTVEFSAASESVYDTAGTFSITVSLSAASGLTTTIPFTLGGTAVAGTDYSGVTASPLLISAGQTSTTITGTLLDNDLFGAPDKTLTFTLGSPTNVTLGTTAGNTLTIVNTATQPTVEFTAASESLNDTAGTFSVTVSLSTASGVDTTIPFTLGGTAVAGTDYSDLTPTPLVISAGQTTATITGTLLDNDIFGAANKTLTFTLASPSNATLGTTASNTLTIVNTATQPTVQLSTSNNTVAASSGTFSVTVNLSGLSTTATTVPFTLGGTAVAGVDYSNVTTSPLVIPAGQTTATITGTLIPHAGPPQTLAINFANTTDTLTISEPSLPLIATGAGPGSPPLVRVFNADGSLRFSFDAYDSGFTGGVNVAVGDVNGDGIPDIITGPGPGGGPLVKVFDGSTGNLITSFFAYNPEFRGGVSVAAGDVNGDGKADIIVGAGPGGGPQVEVFNATKLGMVQANGQLAPAAVLQSFYAYNSGFRGGVNVAAGDVNGDGKADIITGPGPGMAPQVNVFNGVTDGLLISFSAFPTADTGGVHVAADVNGDGKDDIIVGAGPNIGPQVRVYSGANGSQIEDFEAYDSLFQGGVSVAAADVNGDGVNDIITGAGPGGSPHVEVFDGKTGTVIESFYAEDSTLATGVMVG